MLTSRLIRLKKNVQDLMSPLTKTKFKRCEYFWINMQPNSTIQFCVNCLCRDYGLTSVQAYSDRSWRTVHFGYTFRYLSVLLLDYTLAKKKFMVRNRTFIDRQVSYKSHSHQTFILNSKLTRQ